MWHDDYIKQIEDDARSPFDGIVLGVILSLMIWAALYLVYQVVVQS